MAEPKIIEGEIEAPKGNKVAKRPAEAISAPSKGNVPIPLLDRIIADPTLSIERVNQAIDVYMRMDQARARKAFIEAKTAFKANAPKIFKDMENKQYGSRYSSIGNVVNTVNEALSKYSLDASWEFDQGEKSIKVTCILTHADGHSERVSLSGPPDVSGSKNPIQQIKSTTTYLKLATFEAVTGIASKEGALDDDGNAAGRAASAAQSISDAQRDVIQSAIVEGNRNLEKFLKYFKIENVGDLPIARYVEAAGMLGIKHD